jgi:hypothetical protein
VSRADFHELAREIKDAHAFVKRHAREIRRLSRQHGVQHLALDFGIARRDAAAQFDRFPPMSEASNAYQAPERTGE